MYRGAVYNMASDRLNMRSIEPERCEDIPEGKSEKRRISFEELSVKLGISYSGVLTSPRVAKPIELFWPKAK